jgi:ribose 5-phosphate isomerase B
MAASSPVRRVVLGADHAGFPLKEAVKKHLLGKGIDVIDEGTFSEDPVDYPHYIRKACAVVTEQGMPGIVFGGSGNGEAMAANKVHGIRAALCYSKETAVLARQHNDANVLSLGARLTPEPLALELVDIFLSTEFEGGRHIARVNDLEPA